MPKGDLDQIKVHITKELKDKFKAKVKQENKTQTNILKTLIHKYLNS
jgi:predicted DNA-binding protein